MFIAVWTELGCSLINLSKIKCIEMLYLGSQGWMVTFVWDDGKEKTIAMEEKEGDRFIEKIKKMKLTGKEE